ncbi:MAG: 2-C-methyl-D-erythritol 4-phosphate cytidylyltransferase [Bacteroidetes bacterium]|nr:2-C-methyl-D-erythritol 4-phosphate cytidylyltransferase [Bacteroidota bacterium]
MNEFIVCIPAAGCGRRMGGSSPKQYLPLRGRTVLERTLDVFDLMEKCRAVFLAVDDVQYAQSLIDATAWSMPIHIVSGGVRRQDSVARALERCDDNHAIVLVHDAARPCVTPAQVSAVVEAVCVHGAALLALPARDTMKRVHAGVVRETLDRSIIWHAQTPQAAHAGLLRLAFAEAQRRGIEATDDVSLLEAMDVPVHVVEGSPENIKITTPEDLSVAEAILALQGRV